MYTLHEPLSKSVMRKFKAVMRVSDEVTKTKIEVTATLCICYHTYGFLCPSSIEQGKWCSCVYIVGKNCLGIHIQCNYIVNLHLQ